MRSKSQKGCQSYVIVWWPFEIPFVLLFRWFEDQWVSLVFACTANLAILVALTSMLQDEFAANAISKLTGIICAGGHVDEQLLGLFASSISTSLLLAWLRMFKNLKAIPQVSNYAAIQLISLIARPRRLIWSHFVQSIEQSLNSTQTSFHFCCAMWNRPKICRNRAIARDRHAHKTSKTEQKHGQSEKKEQGKKEEKKSPPRRKDSDRV